jgi:tRNA-specific 2-thiouridylase
VTCPQADRAQATVPQSDRGGQLEVSYRTKPVAATLQIYGDGAQIELSAPQVCAPGQSGVLYDGEVLLGGGIIEAR